MVQKYREMAYDYFKEYVYYDESSYTGLRWVDDRYSGKNRKTLARQKDGVAGSLAIGGKYWQININSEVWLAHRIVWVICNKINMETSQVIDHIDRNGLNNNIHNLRATSQSVNISNVDRIKKVSSYKNIVWQENRNRWRVYCNFNGKQLNTSFNPRTLHPELPANDAKDICEKYAIFYAKYVDHLRYLELIIDALPNKLEVIKLFLLLYPDTVSREDLLKGIDTRLHLDYIPTEAAVALSRQRIIEMLPKEK